jgi:hypothetical protein
VSVLGLRAQLAGSSVLGVHGIVLVLHVQLGVGRSRRDCFK